MSIEVIIAAIIISVVFALSLIWIKKSLSHNSELSEKAELAAQVPLLQTRISELKALQVEQSSRIDRYRDEVSQKDIALSELRKDFNATQSNLVEKNQQLDKAHSDVNALEESTKEYESKLYALQSSIDTTRFTCKALEEDKSALSSTLSEVKNSLNEFRQINTQLRTDNATLHANVQAQKESSVVLKNEFEEQSKKLELKLNEIMQERLDGKLKKFDESSMKSLETLLKPFKENLNSFKEKVELSQESSTKKFAELSKEIEQVTKAGMNISAEAQNLANALKSKKQMQGSWGEMILESVLEYSGLLKGVHYDTQSSYKDEDGDTKRPDVVVHLPQNRTIIIDSKVSLNAYSEYTRAQSEEEQNLRAKEVVEAFKNQIDNLDSKDYAHYKIGTLQYVFMFIPIEGAFALAIQQDSSLYEYALKRHIAMVTPSTLTVSLHTIYLYWQSDQSTSLATKLFEEAGRLYDKMYTFSETFAKVGSQLQTLNKSYETAHKQMSEGSGNLLGRVSKLKKLGARTSKNLSTQKIEFQELDLDEVEVEIVSEMEKIAVQSDD